MELPEGYKLKEDDHVVYLLYQGDIVAAWSSSTLDESQILTYIATTMLLSGR